MEIKDSEGSNTPASKSFTDYEKYHMHDHVYNKTDIDKNIETVKKKITNLIAN